MTDSDAQKVAGVAISSPDRVVFPAVGVTKADLAEYYAAIADRMLPETADRPLSLVRLPSGIGGERFFQKHLGKGFPEGLKPVDVKESDGSAEAYMYVTDAAGLVGAAQMGTIEFHIWGARRDRLERPDRMVFDFDPDEGLGFDQVRQAARDLRETLQRLSLPSWPMVTGGKGVHVVVPLRRTVPWETMTLFSRTLATHLARSQPDRFTSEMSKAKRKGRIFIDWLRNQRGSTAVAPYSVRAHDTAPVAVPVTWKELEDLDRADGFGLKDALSRPEPVPEAPAPGTLGRKTIGALEKLIAQTGG